MLFRSLVVFPLAAIEPQLSRQLLADARDGRLDRFDFFSATLIASGIEDVDELAEWGRQYALRSQRLLDSLDIRFNAAATESRLQTLHTLAHEEFLSGSFDAAASDLRQTIGRGNYNCLSSLAIYCDLCQAVELNLEIWWQPGHVFVRHAAPGQPPVIVEPAAKQWGSAPASQRAKRRMLARQISPVQLLGKFYYNRGVAQLRDNQFADGLEMLRTSLALDPEDRDAKANLVAGLNNWAVEYLRAERYRDAASLVEQGLKIDPTFTPLMSNQRLLDEKLRN